MDDLDLKQALEALAARLERVEHLLQISADPVPPSMDVDADVELPSLADAPPVSPTAAQPPTPPPVIAKADTFKRPHQTWQDQPAASQPTSPAPPTTAETSIPPPIPQMAPPPIPPMVPPTSGQSVQRAPKPMRHFDTAEEKLSLEMLIGGKGLAWVGALVVLLAMAFLIMVAVRKGWWGNLPPLVRCLSIAGFGALLIAGGEFSLRKFGKAASVGLFSAGLGTLYLDSFAAFQPFKLVGEIHAFPLLGGVALLGFFITVRTRFLTIGVLSLVGGYLAPLLLWARVSESVFLPLYLTMLFSIALGLSAWNMNHYRPLRYIALAGQLLISLIWIMSEGSTAWKPAMVFMAIWSVMLLAELIFAALREQSARGNVIASVLGTASFVTAGCWLLQQFQPAGFNWLGAFTLAVAIINAAAALQFGPGLDVLRGTVRSAIDKLALALWIEAGVLLATAVALHFDGFGQSIGWLAVGLASIEIGRRLPSRGVTVFGLVVGSLALIRVLTLDWWVTRGMSATIWTFGLVEVSRWSLLAVLTVAVIHVAARRVRAKPQAAVEAWPMILAVIGTAVWMIVCVAQCKGLTATTGWLLGAAALLALEPFGKRQKYFEIALVALMLTAGRWLLLDAMAERMRPGWKAAVSLPVLNWQMGLAAAIAAAGVWAYRIMRRRERSALSEQPSARSAAKQDRWQLVLLCGAVFGLIALSFEIDHAVMRAASGVINAKLSWSISQMQQLFLTLLWAIGSGGLGLLALVIRRNDPDGALRPVSLLLGFARLVMLACALKWLIGDTLYYALAADRTVFTNAMPLVNVQMFVGLMLAATAVILVMAGGFGTLSEPRIATDENKRWHIGAPINLADWVPVGASILVLWGLSFEVDRALERIVHPPSWVPVWPQAQLLGLWCMGLWTVGGVAMMLIGRWRRMQSMRLSGWWIIAATAAAWLTYGTLSWRFSEGVAHVAVFLNLQFMVGAVTALMLGGATWSIVKSSLDKELLTRDTRAVMAGIGFGLVMACGLWLGSLEIDRFFSDADKKQVGFSVYWGVYAVLLIVLGFSSRAAAARYVGLALLAITLGKAFIVDMKAVELMWRAVIFLVVGLLFIGTSMLYIKLAPRMVSRDENLESN